MIKTFFAPKNHYGFPWTQIFKIYFSINFNIIQVGRYIPMLGENYKYRNKNKLFCM
jgi:hypothetical protein